MKESIAILWDVENVTPPSKSQFVNGLVEYASELGRVSVAIAYSDWTRSGMKGIAEVLSEASFELTHVPHNSHKNSSDITLITRAIEIIHQYPHIRKMVLVTGDADFRPLLQSMRKYGIETIIICDAKSASEDLLVLADTYRDFRDIISMAESDENAGDDRDEKDGRKGVGMSFPEAVELLKEAVQVLARRRKATSIGAVKIRMRLLNPNFNEKELYETKPGRKGRGQDEAPRKLVKFRSWKDFVVAAVKADPALDISYDEKDTLINLKQGAPSGAGNRGAAQGSGAKGQTIQIPEIIRELLVAVRNVQKSRSQAGDTNPFVPYSTVSQYLIDVNVDPREHGYSRIRTLVEAAEKRDLLETHSEGQHWMCRLSEEGAKYC